jgi:hypothetical protein
MLRSRDEVTVQPPRRNLDPTCLAGRWVNTNTHGRGIRELAIEIDRGRVKLEVFAFATTATALCACGTTEAGLVCGSDVHSQIGSAFTASYDFGAFQMELQGNLNLGLLVVANFNRVGAGCYDYFSREFYRRGVPAAAPPSVPWSEAVGRIGGDDPIEPDRATPGLPFDGSEMFGEWLNTNPASTGIAKLQIEGDGSNSAIVRVCDAQSPHPANLGVAPAALFALSSGSRLAQAFSARYHSADIAVTLQANIKQGVLVVASFTEFKDNSRRSNYFHREFYYRS